MRQPRLLDLFTSLEVPTTAAALCAARTSPASRYRVARGSDGDAFVLVEIGSGGRTSDARAIRLRHLEYEPWVSATVHMTETHSTETRDFLVLRCRDGEPDMQAHFLGLAEGLIDYLGEDPSHAEADRAVRDLVELFRAMSGRSRRTMVGLWSELLIIADSEDPEFAAAAWHADPGERHDFKSGNQVAEVKSTTRLTREHEVALDQLITPAGGVALVISFMLEASDVGVSANDLLDVASQRLPTRSLARIRLRTIVAETIGEDWREAALARFDVSRARGSRRIYDAASIPSVDPLVPPQISHVRFTVDLSDTVSLTPLDASARGSLPRALFTLRPA